MPKDSEQFRLPDHQSTVGIIISGVILFFGVGSFIAWHGPDPSQVVRTSAPEVPNFSHLSKEETIAKLRETSLDKPSKYPTFILKLSNDGSLQLTPGSTQSSFQRTRTIPIAQIDTFLYAQQAAKGNRFWNIHLYCANYKECITGSNSRAAGNFSLNADSIFYMLSNGDVYQVLGLLNRLLVLHGAESTIDTSKNTIRISREYWEESTENQVQKASSSV